MAEPKVPTGKTPEQIAADEAAAKAAKPPEPTAEEKSKSIDAFITASTYPQKPETDEEKKEREKKEAELAAAEKAKAEEAAKLAAKDGKGEKPAEAPAKKVTPAKKVIRRAAGYEDVPGADRMAAAADKLTEAAEKVSKAAEKPAAPEPPKLELSAEEKRELEVLSKLEEVFKDKPQYKGIAKRAEKYLAELPKFTEDFEATFLTKWERQNASKDFDSEDARDTAFNDARSAAFEKEAEKFKAKFNISPEDSDFRRAEIRLETEPVHQELAQAKKQLTALEQKRQREEAVESAKEKSQQAVVDFASQAEKVIGEEFKGVVKEDGTLDADKLAEVSDGDIIGEVLTDAAERAKNFAEAAAIAFAGGKNDLFDQVDEFCFREEKRIMSLPAEQQIQDGKKFSPRADYMKMTQAERAKHWILDEDTVITRGNDVILAGAKQQIEAERDKIKQRLERRGLKPTDGKAAPAKAAAKKETPATNGNAKPNSPASVDPAASTTPAKAGDNGFLTAWAAGRVPA